MMNFKDIELKGLNSKGEETKLKLSDLKGKNIILYFYPKDETPICTKEAWHFRDAMKELPKDTVVIGVSPDSIESHKAFFKKHKLNFEILSDTEHKLAKAFKNVKEKIHDKKIEMKMKHEEKKLEKEKPITMRSTFIIGKDGKLLKEMRDIDIRGHVDEVVDFIKTIK